MLVLLIATLMHATDDKYQVQARWADFCEKHIVADAPEDYERRERELDDEEDKE